MSIFIKKCKWKKSFYPLISTYFSHKTISSMKDFTDYLKKELELYIYENSFMQDKTDIGDMIKDKKKKIFALLKRDVNFLVLNIKNYRFKF
jgi:hypothetical protein